MNPYQFTDQDTAIVKNMMLTRSARQIASLLDCDKVQVEMLITELSSHAGVISYQQKIEDAAASKPAKIKKVKDKQLHLQRKKEEKTKNLLERLRVDQEKRKERIRGPKFKTVAVDYTKLTAVCIDRKTVIYAKPGQDVEKLKEDFLNRYKKHF